MRYWLSSFSLLYIIINFLLASLKLITNFENAYLNLSQNSLLCVWSVFSTVVLEIMVSTSLYSNGHDADAQGRYSSLRPLWSPLLHSRTGIMRYEWLPHILLISKYYGVSWLSYAKGKHTQKENMFKIFFQVCFLAEWVAALRTKISDTPRM